MVVLVLIGLILIIMFWAIVHGGTKDRQPMPGEET